MKEIDLHISVYMTDTKSTNLYIFFKQQANFRCVHNPQEVPISWVTTVHLSVCQSARTSSFPTGQILVKYYIGHFIKFVKKIHVWLKSDKNNETLYGKISTF